MELKFTINTDDLYDYNDGDEINYGNSFEKLMADGLVKAIKKDVFKKIEREEFKKFSELTSDTIVADIKTRMHNFLSEDIIITGRYGEKDFVGSIEDLIKKRFDDVLLRPVNNNGETLKGCTSSTKTWIEWRIGDLLEEKRNSFMNQAKDNILRETKKYVEKKLVEIKDSAIKDQVDSAFITILKK